MLTRSHTYHFPVQKDELKNRLVGKHVNIHNLDFEIFEKDRKLSIIPHAEQVDDIKTLPVTSVTMREDGNGTTVVVKSHVRQLDAGGLILLLLFCGFMAAASLLVYALNRETTVALVVSGISALVFILFCVRLQTGYFDYVRKVREYVESKGQAFGRDNNNLPLAA